MTAAAASGAGTRLSDNEQRPIWPALCGQARHWLVSREERGGRITSGSEAANRRSRKRRSRLRLRNLRICNCVCRPDAERGRGDNTCQTDDPEFTHCDCPFVPCESALTSHRTHPRPVIAVTKWRKSPHPVPPTTTQSRSILHNTRAIRQPQSLVTAQLALAAPG